MKEFPFNEHLMLEHHNHMINKNIKLTENQIIKVNNYAEVNRYNFSQMIRQMIDLYLE